MAVIEWLWKKRCRIATLIAASDAKRGVARHRHAPVALCAPSAREAEREPEVAQAAPRHVSYFKLTKHGHTRTFAKVRAHSVQHYRLKPNKEGCTYVAISPRCEITCYLGTERCAVQLYERPSLIVFCDTDQHRPCNGQAPAILRFHHRC